METKRDIEAKAKSLIESSPDEAVELYKNLWTNFREEFNDWDAFFSIKALRAATVLELEWAHDLATTFENDRVRNLYGWLIFDKCIKNKNHQQIISNERYISDLGSICPQKNMKEDNSFPCPTTISIFKVIDAHNENIFHAHRINELLANLNFEFLSRETRKIDTEKRGEIELASDFEKFITLKTKALLKLEEFSKCKEYCEIGLKEIPDFHYNNDLWLKMRIALCEEHLGNLADSEKLLQDLLNSRAGSDKWFLYKELAEVYYQKEDYEKSWKYAVDAAFYGNEPHFLIGLYLLQARILVRLNRESEGKVLAELIASILNDQDWNDKADYNKLFEFYEIDRSNLREESKTILQEARKFWSKERYGSNPKSTGKIIDVHRNGKIGRIKHSNGSTLGFHKKDLVQKTKFLNHLINAEVEFYSMNSFDGKAIAEAIHILSLSKDSEGKASEGEKINGTVKNITNFGIFIKLPGRPDGLLHKNNLPANLKDNYESEFKPGDNVSVEVQRITDKGIQLKYLQKK